MNRREFVKVLAGIPLLGLLPELLEVEEELKDIDTITEKISQ